jgi:hypothetical protein
MHNVVPFPIREAKVTYLNKPLTVKVYDYLEEDLKHELLNILMDFADEYLRKPSFGTVLTFADRLHDVVRDD